MLDPQQVKAASRAVETVDSIDNLIEWLGRDVEKEDTTWGDILRGAIGRNRLNRLTDERLGQIAFVGIVNELLRERDDLVLEYGEIVRFPPPPCPEQRLPGND